MRTVVQGYSKPEYQPLFSPGFHDVDDDVLDEVFVEPFPDSSVRKKLVENLRSFLAVIKATGIKAEVWIDGSFTTKKPDPADVDAVIYFDPAEVQGLDVQHQVTLAELADTNKSKLRYKCDVYFAPNNNQERRSYWRGWFCFTRAEEPKGIARMFI